MIPWHLKGRFIWQATVRFIINWFTNQRVQSLGAHIENLVKPGWSVVDMVLVMETRKFVGKSCSKIKISGFDTLVRGETLIDTKEFDGERLPLEDRSVDAVMLVDVLHHADDPFKLMEEACRVAKKRSS